MDNYAQWPLPHTKGSFAQLMPKEAISPEESGKYATWNLPSTMGDATSNEWSWLVVYGYIQNQSKPKSWAYL